MVVLHCCSDHLKAQQSSCVDVSCVKEILDTMDINADPDITKIIENVSEDPLWDEILLVKPEPIEAPPKKVVLCDLEGDYLLFWSAVIVDPLCNRMETRASTLFFR